VWARRRRHTDLRRATGGRATAAHRSGRAASCSSAPDPAAASHSNGSPAASRVAQLPHQATVCRLPSSIPASTARPHARRPSRSSRLLNKSTGGGCGWQLNKSTGGVCCWRMLCVCVNAPAKLKARAEGMDGRGDSPTYPIDLGLPRWRARLRPFLL